MLTEEEMLEIAKRLRLDIEKLQADANSFAVRKQIESEIEEAASKGINGTPTTEINGKLYVGIKPYEEYKKILIEAGAEEK